MTKKSIWERIDESESLQIFFIVTMVMMGVSFFFGLIFLGLKLLGWI
jgi:hypothetical protein